ncbi:hypothetical protein [Pseudoclavibacter endophyticus]|nr:hypothetical protein [Pseudoclavibacter endophyticus]
MDNEHVIEDDAPRGADDALEAAVKRAVANASALSIEQRELIGRILTRP